MKVDVARLLVHFWFSRHWLGMQARQSASLHRPIGIGFWLLATCVVAACSDDGNLLGSETSAGSGGAQAGSGGAQAGSGGAQAGSGGTQAGGGGTQAGAGTSAGGSVVAGAGGSGSEGGSSQGGDAGTSSGGASGGGCVGETCAANETCVAHRTIGGAVFPPGQNDQCVDGRHLEGSYCQPDFTYSCATLTGCSAPSATCRCAAGTECANTTVCRLPSASAWLDTDAQLVCELLAP